MCITFSPLSLRVVAVVVAVMSSFSWFASADTRSEFEIGRNLFSNGQYERASEVFAALMAEPHDPRAPDSKKQREVLQAARPLFAATLVALGRGPEADHLVLEQLRDDPFYEPPAGQLPEPVMQRFVAVAAEHAEELERQRQVILRDRQEAVAREQREREAQRQAEQAKNTAATIVVTRRSRLVALLPFGVGQFQNGEVGRGIFFATSEVLAAAASFGTLIAAQHYAAVDCRFEDCDAARRGFETVRTVNWISVGLTTALVVAGVIEAEATLVAVDRTTQKRAALGWTFEPLVDVGPGFASFGLSSAF